MDSVINYIQNHVFLFSIIGVLLIFMVYSFYAVLLNKLNNAKYEKTTIVAWIPILNIYLLGKLVVHEILGILLVLALLFGICVYFNIPYLESIHSLLPKDLVIPYILGYLLIILILVIMAKFILNKILREKRYKVNDIKEEPKTMNSQVNNNQEMISDSFYYTNTSSNNGDKNNNENPQ